MYCLHCKIRPVAVAICSEAKVCQSCFLFAMVQLLDDGRNLLPSELKGKTIAESATIMGDQWDKFVLEYYNAVAKPYRDA